MIEQSSCQRINILHSSDAFVARRAAKTIAEDLSFVSLVCEEIALVVYELASNLLRHTKGGMITLKKLGDGRRVGIQIESSDSGPGIADIEQALTDGFSAAGSLGYGLGTVNRLMDEFDITSHRGTGGGTHIVAKRWKREDVQSIRECPLDFGAATRPYPGMALNGDTYVIKSWEESVLVAVIDGLGHGQFAHRAAQKARQFIENHFDSPLAEIFHNTGRSCRATRGVVMALAHFNWGENKIAFASIGNIEARVSSRTPVHFIVRRGIVGVNAPNAVVTEHHWEFSNMMVLHTDGLTSHWDWKDFVHLADKPAAFMAQQLLHALAKDNDDATVVVVKGKQSLSNE